MTVLSSVHDSRLKALRERHEDLSRQIEEAQRCLSTKDFLINKLKKQKLRVKEKLEEFQIIVRERKTS